MLQRVRGEGAAMGSSCALANLAPLGLSKPCLANLAPLGNRDVLARCTAGPRTSQSRPGR